MLIIPVMYLRGGSALKPSGNAVDLAKTWFNSGAELIHIVDLDAPATGPSPNMELIRKIKSEVKIDLEIESHIRSVDTAEKYISSGVIRLTLGAVAYQQPAFLAELCKRFPNKISVHIDVRRGKVAIKGWTVASNKTATDYVEQFKKAGVKMIHYSDSEEEGSLKLQDFGRIRDFLRKAHMQIVHTTDITSNADIDQLIMLESYGLAGTLVSNSLYAGKIDLGGAITYTKEQSQGSMDEPTLVR